VKGDLLVNISSRITGQRKKDDRMRTIVAIFLAAASGVALSGQAASKWVAFGDGQTLRYTTDERGNRIMDFSHAGYKGGGVTLPAVLTARTVKPMSGDNTAQIQAAIDEVSRLPLDALGFRGAVLLERGTYDVAGTLTIAASGVVLRGSGAAEGATLIQVTGTPHRFLDMAGSGTWQRQGEPAPLWTPTFQRAPTAFGSKMDRAFARATPFSSIGPSPTPGFASWGCTRSCATTSRRHGSKRAR
jgi:hypothetical protein